MRLMSRTRSRSSLVSEYKFGTYRFGITSAWNSALGDRSRKASNSYVSALSRLGDSPFRILPNTLGLAE